MEIERQKKLHDPRNNLSKPEKDYYEPVRIGNAFSSNCLEYSIKIMEIKTNFC